MKIIIINGSIVSFEYVMYNTDVRSISFNAGAFELRDVAKLIHFLTGWLTWMMA